MTLKNLVLVFLLCGGLSGSVLAGAFRDPLDQPARQFAQASREPLQAIARAGDRLVAVGMRGVVVVSDDAGQSWRQVEIPVSTDLLAVQFINPKQGWIGGDGGVILHTRDGGNTWIKLVDGRDLATQLTDSYQRQVELGNADAAGYLEEIRANFESGPEQPILGIWFEDANNGFATSTFGMLLVTHDGGATWQSWMERVEDERRLHYYSINGIAGDLYLTAEQGTVFRLDRERQRFARLDTGYQGGLFGIVGDAERVVAFGLQGNAFASQDRGEHWQPLPPLGVGINAGLLTSNGSLALATQDGRLLFGRAGERLTPQKPERPMLFTGLAASDTGLVVTGFGGVQTVALPK